MLRDLTAIAFIKEMKLVGERERNGVKKKDGRERESEKGEKLQAGSLDLLIKYQNENEKWCSDEGLKV